MDYIPQPYTFFRRRERSWCFCLGPTNSGAESFLTRPLCQSNFSFYRAGWGGHQFVLGCILGGISGYYGRALDTIIQRIIEFLISIPTIPLWMALSAALPPDWPPIRVYFGITAILSILGWTGLARVVRGKILQLREEDFVMAAKVGNSTNLRRHPQTYASPPSSVTSSFI